MKAFGRRRSDRRLPGWMSVVVEWRASRIEDPVARLQYLRRVAVERERPRARRRPWIVVGLVAGLLAPVTTTSDAGRVSVEPNRGRPAPLAGDWTPHVWLVDRKTDQEVYSNGLRIETRYASRAENTGVRVFRRVPRDRDTAEWIDKPAGIVFHTTESHILPFEEGQNQALKRHGEGLLHYVRTNRSYHFVIDRFGRVYRIVPETDPANHAGRSLWSDAGSLYVDLNHSFLGVAFEAQTRSEGGPVASAAQIHSARVLTATLRSRYGISKANCVTHAQVSVNPDNWRIGSHTDWAADFPFVEIGLTDNYAQPPAALTEFGFSYDPAFIESTGARLWQGLAAAEELVRQSATSQGRTVGQYRTQLKKRYRDLSAALEGELEKRRAHHGAP